MMEILFILPLVIILGVLFASVYKWWMEEKEKYFK